MRNMMEERIHKKGCVTLNTICSSWIEWIPVTERLPRLEYNHKWLQNFFSRRVLVAWRDHIYIAQLSKTIATKEGLAFADENRVVIWGVSHWAELPFSPAKPNESGEWSEYFHSSEDSEELRSGTTVYETPAEAAYRRAWIKSQKFC